MSVTRESIEVEMPLRTVYDQWTQFEQFPQFMSGVEEVRQLDDVHLHWVASIAGQRREWDAQITGQEPDRRVAWESTTGARNAGTVTFEPVDDNHTRVNLELDFEPEGLVEKAGDTAGLVSHQAREDLERFKEFIARRGEQTGSWRGSV